MSYEIGAMVPYEDEIVGYDDEDEVLDALLGDDEDDDDYDEVLGEDDDVFLVGDDDDEDDYLVGRRRFGGFRSRRKRRGRARARPRARVRRARPRRRMRRPSPVSRAMVAKEVAGSAIVKQTTPTKSREYPLGFDSVTTVAAAATANITTRPQVLFRPDRLVVAAAIAPSFLINDLKIGKNSQLISGTALPAEAFSSLAVGVGMKLDTASIAIDITLSVTNISAGALRFNGALIGPAIE